MDGPVAVLHSTGTVATASGVAALAARHSTGRLTGWRSVGVAVRAMGGPEAPGEAPPPHHGWSPPSPWRANHHQTTKIPVRFSVQYSPAHRLSTRVAHSIRCCGSTTLWGPWRPPPSTALQNGTLCGTPRQGHVRAPAQARRCHLGAGCVPLHPTGGAPPSTPPPARSQSASGVSRRTSLSPPPPRRAPRPHTRRPSSAPRCRKRGHAS